MATLVLEVRGEKAEKKEKNWAVSHTFQLEGEWGGFPAQVEKGGFSQSSDVCTCCSSHNGPLSGQGFELRAEKEPKILTPPTGFPSIIRFPLQPAFCCLLFRFLK